jgi:hypothetical protein
MDYQKALSLKNEISFTMLAKKKGSSQIISFAAGTRGAALNSKTEMFTQVNGVGIAERSDGNSCIKIFTREALRTSNAALANNYGLMQEDILVETIGKIEFKSAKANHRPPFPGISIGHYKITAGTIGCFVQDTKGNVSILSNNHILANTNNAFWGDPILQPGTLDGGRYMIDEIAHLSHLVPLEFSRANTMDAAIAKVVAKLDINTVVGKSKRVTGIASPTYNQKVEKYGRTTGHTTGSITTRNLDLQVDFEGKLIDFEDQFEIKGGIKNGKRTKFCLGGDSGSLILEKGTGNAVGLLFAGADDGTTFATPISEVLSAFSVKIL